MPRSKESACSLLCLLVGLALVAVPAAAQPPINPGVDIFTTSAGAANPTFVNFANNPIPAGFFCPGSPAFAGAIALKGVPLTTIPAGIAGSSDVVVQRNGASFIGGVATMNVIVRALRLTSVSNLTINCGGIATQWRVDACACGSQTTTTIQAKVDQACGCGHFNGTLSVRVCLRFTRLDTGETRGPIQQLITLRINNMPWCPNPGRSETTIPTSFGVDTNCDGQVDLTLPPTSNFHPGWTCATQAAGDCWTQFADLTHCHENFSDPDAHDHCVNPVCGRQTATP